MLQAQERERYFEADKARLLVELINERKRKFAQQRAEQRRNKPMTQAQQRTYMCNYIKNMGNHTLQQLKKLSFDEVKELFETIMKRVNTFTPMESDDTVPKVVAGSSKIDAEQELNQESSKRQKIGEGSEPAEESKDELSQEQLQQLMIIVPEEGMNVEALQTKYPIIDWEVYTEDSRKYWKIIRVGNHTEVYQIFEDMLKNFDRDDLVKLWSLVHERFNSTEPTEDKERELWVELKRLFEPDDDDTLWKLQRYMHDPLKWRLYDTCAVHHVSTLTGRFTLKIQENTGKSSDWVIIQRLFKHVVSIFLELAIDYYISHDRVIHPLAPHYERKTGLDHSKKKPHESNASSSSTTLNHPSSSSPLDNTIDVNDDESFHSNSSSPSQNVSSPSNVVPRVCQNPHHESHKLNTYLSETINLQT
ncbi:hypothetical protein Tco_0967851 [Tanacetum coccineum]